MLPETAEWLEQSAEMKKPGSASWSEYFDYQPYIKAFYEDLISETK